jgi:hypothetical protein
LLRRNKSEIKTTEGTKVVGPIKTRQTAVSKIVVNTWTCNIEYESPSKFKKIEETTNEVFASTQVEEKNPHSDCIIIAAKKKPGLCLRSRHHHPRRPRDHRDYHPLRAFQE